MEYENTEMAGAIAGANVITTGVDIRNKTEVQENDASQQKLAVQEEIIQEVEVYNTHNHIFYI